ncbi:SDR family oxidoreductase [Bavariicoccus seileri]|uniref:SDR family oxidoreductase n=1 Tax=Bavariicoccus seileri TaxID=549685 RepID=UPI003F8E60C5
MDLGLTGKNVLVLASSQGLGKASAIEFVKEGANVVISSRNEEKLEAVQNEVEALNLSGTIHYFPTDVTSTQKLSNLVDYTVKTLGGIDVLVNNAGGPPSGSFTDFTDDDWENAFHLNLLSYVRTIRLALPYLKKHGGHIINIASSSIKEPIDGLILSNTFRLGIVGLSKSLANELGPFNILVNTVAPGRVLTDRINFLDNIKAEKTGQTTEEVRKQDEKQIPLRRLGDPEEFAKAVVFLSSSANSYITGSSILVDGGKVRAI